MQYFNLHTHSYSNQSDVVELVNQYPQEFNDVIPNYSIGIHPWFIVEDRIESDLAIMESKLKESSCLAVGECGLDKRIEMAKAIRSESTMHKANSAMSIMDANLKAVAESFQGKWPDGYYVGKSDVILHGHTHRCAIHPTLDSKAPEKPESTQGTLQKGLRIVLPDWDFDGAEKNRPTGGFVKMLPNGEFSLTLFNRAA